MKVNRQVSIYIPDDLRLEIEKSLSVMGFANLHQYLQHASYYLLSEFKKDPRIIRKEETIKKPEI